MKFLGIDLGWQGKPTGLALAELRNDRLSLLETTRIESTDEILNWVDAAASDGEAMVAVDAPLIINNEKGMRPLEREMNRRYAKYHAGTYPANLGRPFAQRVTQFSADLSKRGFQHASQILAQKAGSYQIEVHPHAATVELFNLSRIIKYKKGRLSERFEGLNKLRNLLIEKLPLMNPPLQAIILPELKRHGAELKDAEDQIDAVTCAYVGAHWWYWGTERNMVYGSEEEGYIVVPDRRAIYRS